MLARELVEKYNIDVSRLSDPEYAAEVEKRIADTSWVYMEYYTNDVLSAQYILYDASQYRMEYFGKGNMGILRAREGVVERGEVYHTILGAIALQDLFYKSYEYADANTHLVIKFEDGFANNLKIPMNVIPMSTSLSIWMDLSNFVTVQKNDLGFASSYFTKVRIWNVNDIIANALISQCHFTHIFAAEKAQKKIIDVVNREFAGKDKIAYWQAKNISEVVNNQYLPLYKELEFTDISASSISKLCDRFSCSIEEISRLSGRGANFTCALEFSSRFNKDLLNIADLFNKYNGYIYFSNITISRSATFKNFGSNWLCFEKCRWKGFNFDELLGLKVKYPVEIYSLDDDCNWSERWLDQDLEKDILFSVRAINNSSRQGELASILRKVDRGNSLSTSEKNRIVLSYLIYGSKYMSHMSELSEELRKLLSEVRVTRTPPVVIPSISSVNDIPSYGTVVSVDSVKELSLEDKKVLTGVMKSSLGVMLSISSSVESRYTIGEVRQILLDKGYPRSLVNESIVSYLADLRLAR